VSGSYAEALVRGATVAPDVLVAAVLVGKAPKEGLAGHGSGNICDPILARLLLAI
jgi:hypothetical protein